MKIKAIVSTQTVKVKSSKTTYANGYSVVKRPLYLDKRK